MRYDQYEVGADVGLNGTVTCRRCEQSDQVDRLDHAMSWAEAHELTCDGDDVDDRP